MVIKDGVVMFQGLVFGYMYDMVILVMVGCEIGDFFLLKLQISSFGLVMLLVWDFVVSGMVLFVSFDVYVGEIFGFVGFVGFGRIELVFVIYGVDEVSGKVLIDGEFFDYCLLLNSIDVGILMLMESCKDDGLFLNSFVVWNFVVIMFGYGVYLVWVFIGYEEVCVKVMKECFGVVVDYVGFLIFVFFGGN